MLNTNIPLSKLKYKGVEIPLYEEPSYTTDLEILFSGGYNEITDTIATLIMKGTYIIEEGETA